MCLILRLLTSHTLKVVIPYEIRSSGWCGESCGRFFIARVRDRSTLGGGGCCDSSALRSEKERALIPEYESGCQEISKWGSTAFWGTTSTVTVWTELPSAPTPS